MPPENLKRPPSSAQPAPGDPKMAPRRRYGPQEGPPRGPHVQGPPKIAPGRPRSGPGRTVQRPTPQMAAIPSRMAEDHLHMPKRPEETRKEPSTPSSCDARNLRCHMLRPSEPCGDQMTRATSFYPLSTGRASCYMLRPPGIGEEGYPMLRQRVTAILRPCHMLDPGTRAITCYGLLAGSRKVAAPSAALVRWLNSPQARR